MVFFLSFEPKFFLHFFPFMSPRRGLTSQLNVSTSFELLPICYMRRCLSSLNFPPFSPKYRHFLISAIKVRVPEDFTLLFWHKKGEIFLVLCVYFLCYASEICSWREIMFEKWWKWALISHLNFPPFWFGNRTHREIAPRDF